MNGHVLLEYKDIGLFYCKICHKAEVELQDPCIITENDRSEDK